MLSNGDYSSAMTLLHGGIWTKCYIPRSTMITLVKIMLSKQQTKTLNKMRMKVKDNYIKNLKIPVQRARKFSAVLGTILEKSCTISKKKYC